MYHLSQGFVSRSSGRSAVQSAAYITGEKLHESRRDLEVNYQNRHSDIAFTATLAPEHAPDNFKDIGVWDLLENFEDEEGEYLLFNPTGKVSFVGNKINYRIYFSYKKNTPLSKQSYLNRVTSFGGTSQNQIDNFSVEHKFRDNIFDEKYYKSKYLEFTITAKVSKEPTVTSKCIYKRG